MTAADQFIVNPQRPRVSSAIPPSLEGEKEINAMLNRGDVNALNLIRNRYPRGATPHAIVAWATGLDLNDPSHDRAEEASGYLLLVTLYAKAGDLDTAHEYAVEYNRLMSLNS